MDDFRGRRFAREISYWFGALDAAICPVSGLGQSRTVLAFERYATEL